MLRFNNHPEALIFGSFHQGKEQRLQIANVGIRFTEISFLVTIEFLFRRVNQLYSRIKWLLRQKISVVILKLFI